MNNKQDILELIERSKQIQLNFKEKSNQGVKLPNPMRNCMDIESLSKWVYESLIVINRLKALKDDELCLHFKRIYDNVESMTLDKFQVLIGILKAIISKWDIEETAEKNTVDFYNTINNDNINY